MPRIVSPSPESLAQAAEVIRRGDVIAFPTETVYGLGAATFHAGALERIYRMKGRPSDNPLIAHVLDQSQAQRLTDRWSEPASQLAQRFWPGPLTLVLPKASHVPPRATAGLDTIAVRSPAHLVARSLLQLSAGPISAPSANRSGHVSPTTAKHVAEDFADQRELLIIDGGPCIVGIESTVLDLTVHPPRILRPGSITSEQLAGVVGDVQSPDISQQAASPGTSLTHYAPRTPAELLAWDQLQQRMSQSIEPLAVLTFQPQAVHEPHKAIAMPEDAPAYARQLYAALRRADAMGCARILIEQPPVDSEAWRAVQDRLRRATAPKTA